MIHCLTGSFLACCTTQSLMHVSAATTYLHNHFHNTALSGE